MSKLGQILLFIGILLLICWFVAMRALSGGLFPIVWVVLGLGVTCILAAVFKDIRFFIDLAGQRTTKHGLNLGALVVIVLAFLVGANFIGYRHVKKFDYTKEKLHSLSDQTKNVLKSLQEDLEIRAFFDDSQPDPTGDRARFKEMASMVQAETSRVKISYINPVRRPDVAKAYDITVPGTVALQYKGQKARFEELTEQGLTNAVIKITRGKNKLIYFVKGHGEHDLENTEAGGLQTFKKYLADSSYDVKTLSFAETPKVPEDAAVVIVAGPKQAYFEPEIAALRDYLYRGGKLLLALDPETKSNLGKLAREIGIDFRNNYILDVNGQLLGQGGAMVIGANYSATSEITKGFNAMTIFFLASQLKVASDKIEGITVEEVIKSSAECFTKAELKQGEVRYNPGKDEKGPLTIAASVTGKLREEAGKPSPAEFQAVVVGDSDFMTNQMIDAVLNHDLSLNTVSFLAKDKELVSIRPRTAEGSSITITQMQATVLFYGLVIGLPLLIVVMGGTVWYRRRTA
jgi:ABC-type uncharacterized transport system involved in gliding motility auxiliary subunit